jgi:hypothetical protein
LTRQGLHRVADGSSTDHLDPVIVAKFVSDRGFGQKGLRLHQAGGRMRELARYSQHRSRVVSGAVSEVWRDLNRAEQNKRNEHGRPAVAVDAVAKSNKASFAPRESYWGGYLRIDTESRSAGGRAISDDGSGRSVAKGLGPPDLKSMPDNSARQQQEFDLRIALGQARIATKGWAFPPGGETYARARLLAEQLDRQDCLFPLLGGQFIFHLIHPPLAWSGQTGWGSRASRSGVFTEGFDTRDLKEAKALLDRTRIK